MKKILITLIALFIALAANAQQNHHLSLLGQLQYPGEQLSSLWGYEAPDGTPYAIVGSSTKVSIVSLANPANPTEVATVPGPNTQWREVKVWDHYAYIALDNVNTGMQIIDLQYLPDSVHYINWTAAGILSSHTVTMDENGIMIANGTNLANGAPLLFDVKVHPWNPDFLGTAGSEYAHDSYARGDTLWVANINNGHFTVYDITNKANPVLKGTRETPSKFTHNVWPTDDNRYVFTTDEVGASFITAYDVTDLSDIQETDRWQQSYSTSGDKIPHNVHVRNDYVITAHYSDGTVVLDGHRPGNLVEVARYNSYTQGGDGFVGVWGAFPYFKNHDWILASDMQNGLIVMQPSYQRACYLEGKITDLVSGQPLNNARVEIWNGAGIVSKKFSGILGNYAAGATDAGTYTVKVSKPGYYDKTVSAVLDHGVVTALDVQLEQKVTVTITGNVVLAGTGAPVDSAKVQLKNADFTYEVFTNSSGIFTLPGFYEGDYSVYAGKWGYSTSGSPSQTVTATGAPLTFTLEKGYQDPFSLDLGWKGSGGSFGALWELGDPVEVPAPIAGFPPLQPGYDSPDAGTGCYVTGNNGALPGTLVYGGLAILQSPQMDLTGMVNPKISFASWYLGVLESGLPVATKMRFKLLKGGLTKVVLERTFSLNEPLDWKYDSIDVSQFFTPGPLMRLRVEVGNANEPSQYFEGLLDDFKVTQGTVGTQDHFSEAITVQALPNPSSSHFAIRYSLPAAHFEQAVIQVVNMLGEKVAETTTLAPSGEWYAGKAWPAGVYFVQVRMGNEVSAAVKLVKQ